MAHFRVLVVDDYEPFRRFLRLLLQIKAELQIIGEASDGLEAVQKAEDLQPDLILLDVGLPKLDGIRAAQKIHSVAPRARILFISQESSSDVVQHAVRVGAMGYVLKSRARIEVLPAIDAILSGEQFVSKFDNGFGPQAPHEHEMLICSSEAILLNGLTRFIVTAIRVGNPVIVVATKSHLRELHLRLNAESVDVDSAIRRGTYIGLDAADSFSPMMVDNMPDRDRFLESVGRLAEAAIKAASAEHPRLAFCGEGIGLLWAENKADVAIRLEELCNDLAQKYDMDMLCVYPLSELRGEQEQSFKKICAEHSVVHSR